MKELEKNELKLELKHPSQKLVKALYKTLDTAYQFLKQRLDQDQSTILYFISKTYKERFIDKQNRLLEEFKGAKSALNELLFTCSKYKAPEVDIFQKITDFYPILLAQLDKHLGVSLEKINEIRYQLIRLKQIEPPVLIKDPKPSPVIEEKKPDRLPETYSKLIKRIIEMGQLINGSDEIYLKIQNDLYTLSDDEKNHEKFSQYIIDLNSKDLFDLVIILLAQPEHQILRTKLKTQNATFWNEVLAGNQDEMGYPIEKYTIFPENTGGLPAFCFGGYLGPKIKKIIKLKPSYKHNQEQKFTNKLPTRTSMEIILGVYCFSQAKNYLQAIKCFEGALELLEEKFEVDNRCILQQIIDKLIEAAINEYSPELQLTLSATFSYYTNHYLKLTDPKRIAEVRKVILAFRDELVRIINIMIAEFSQHSHHYIKLGLFWGDFSCYELLYEILLKKRNKISRQEVYTQYVSLIYLVSTNIMNKHLVAGHLFYAGLIKDFIEILAENPDSSIPLIYKCSIEGVKSLYLASTLNNAYKDLAHNAFAVVGKSSYKFKNECSFLFQFFDQQAQKIDPVNTDRLINNEFNKIDKGFKVTFT